MQAELHAVGPPWTQLSMVPRTNWLEALATLVCVRLRFTVVAAAQMAPALAAYYPSYVH